jgi:hypothetical protein
VLPKPSVPYSSLVLDLDPHTASIINIALTAGALCPKGYHRMFIDEADAPELKTWIVKKLEKISDADSDVLADYVLALIRAESPEPELRATAIESLEDFLGSNTNDFVNDVFLAIRTKSYVPGYAPPPSAHSHSTTFLAPSGSVVAYGSIGVGQSAPATFNLSRKRSYNDRQEDGDGVDSHYARGDRQMKQVRRGGRGGRGDGYGLRGGRGGFQDNSNPFTHAGSPPMPQSFPGIPLPSQGLPFDPNDPMAAIMAMQAMGLPPLPLMPPLPHPGTTNGHPQFTGQGPVGPRAMRRERCRDYDTQGYCASGDACPYEHGTDRLIVPAQDGIYLISTKATRLTVSPEYDPKNSLLNVQPTSPIANGHSTLHERGSGHDRGRGRGRGDRGGFQPRRQNNRADFSQAGPNHDRSVTTIVIEQIPEEKFDEQSVRGFFSEFGNIEEVTMQPYKRLALVKYDDYKAAKLAYDSPKVIFDNRFVKVYWYKPGGLPTPPTTGRTNVNSPTFLREDEHHFDKEEFERSSMAAQKRLEEKKAQMKDMEAKRQALEKQKEELAQKQAEEKRKLLEKLKAKSVTGGDDTAMIGVDANGSTRADDSNVSEHTKALRAKVAELEAEAKSLGLDAALTDYTPRGRGRGRGRGSYRGWEGFAARGSGYDSSRGRGRGSFGTRGGGKYNLDNRTKKVGVSGVGFTAEKDEALRHHLLVSYQLFAEILKKGTDTPDSTGGWRVRSYRDSSK